MTDRKPNAPPDRGAVPRRPVADASAPLAAAAQEHRGALLAEALVAACAVIAHADGTASRVEWWRVTTVFQDDALLAALPRGAVAEVRDAQRRAFLADAAAARAAALRQLARLAPEPHKARMVLDACLRIVRADGQVTPAEVQALCEVAAALGIRRA